MDDLYVLLIEHASEDSRYKANNFSGLESFLLAGSLSSFLLGLLFSAAFRFSRSHNSSTLHLVYVSFLVGLCFSVALTFIAVVNGIRSARNPKLRPVPNSLDIRRKRAVRDFELVRRLQSASLAQLQFLSSRLREDGGHARTQLGVLIGAIEKVGVIPFSAGCVASALQLLRQDMLNKPLFYMSILGISALSVVSIMFVHDNNRMDDLAQVVECALLEKSEKERS